jgi:phosphoribosylamine--glycine ligase
MGDPETEVVLPRIKSDLLEVLVTAATGNLNEIKFEISEQTAATVMMVSGGYPESYETGFEIKGLEHEYQSMVFHAGTKIHNNQVLTAGGRVIAVTSFADNVTNAFNKSFETVNKIDFSGKYFRNDLGKDLERYLIK